MMEEYVKHFGNFYGLGGETPPATRQETPVGHNRVSEGGKVIAQWDDSRAPSSNPIAPTPAPEPTGAPPK